MIKKFIWITVDTEAQPVRQSKNHVERLIHCVTETGEYGIRRMMDIADSNDIKITFFVDILAERCYPGKIEEVCVEIFNRGHDVQLHAHQEFTDDGFWEEIGVKRNNPPNIWDIEKVQKVFKWMIEKFEDWGITKPIAFRNGGYRYNDHFITVSKNSGILLHSNYNHLNTKKSGVVIKPQPFNLGPLPCFEWSNGLIEIPISTIRKNSISADNPTRVRFDELFITKNPGSVYEKMNTFFDEQVGPKIITIMMHSWSFLGRNEDTGYYETGNDKKVSAFEEFLANLPDDMRVCTSYEISEMFRNGILQPKISLDLEFASYNE